VIAQQEDPHAAGFERLADRQHRLEEPDAVLEPRIEGGDTGIVAGHELAIEKHRRHGRA
jgi:hypothetical protein